MSLESARHRARLWLLQAELAQQLGENAIKSLLGADDLHWHDP